LYLGMLPREHVLLLRRQSICVLNPSLFEGWGLSVAEAQAVGKRVLVSDIPPHREQDPPGALYFDPADHEALARRMAQIWYEAAPGPDVALEAAARASHQPALRAYGEAFLAVVREAVEERPAGRRAGPNP
ncbi:MAG: glycosyltransferase, partial [Pseudomonadota bacterium]|nr:glycosyltransferase [Pseudomonadota bacterium]